MDLYGELGVPREQDSVKRTIEQVFLAHGTSQLFKKNEFVFQENDLPTAAYFVQSGLIKISRSSEEGQGITLFLRYEGEMFGSAELLANLPRNRYARCLQDCRLLVMDARTFNEIARTDADIGYALAVIGAKRLLQTQQMVETLISRPVAWRLACFLLQLGKTGRDMLEVDIRLSHEEISYVIGCSRQTVTETLNKWREQGLIEYTKRKIVIIQPDRILSSI